MTAKPCKESVPGTSHAKRPAPHPGPRCTTCHRAVKKARRATSHEARVVGVYGLLPGDYERLYEAQGGTCAIHRCRATGASRKLSVDHDHSLIGRESVRGLTCRDHNSWIGRAGDDPAVFDSIAEYLRRPPARKILTD